MLDDVDQKVADTLRNVHPNSVFEILASPETSSARKRPNSPSPKNLYDSNKRMASVERLQTDLRLDEDDSTIDENLYSRQIGAFGLDTVRRLSRLRIFIDGMNGAGVEVAKNLILAGPKSVAIRDNAVVTVEDLGSNFYLRKEDIGTRTRAEACLPSLSNLNEYVSVSLVSIKAPLSADQLAHYDVVVVINAPQSEQLRINELCRTHCPCIGFLALTTCGLACSLFVDFGDDFTIHDATGEPLQEALIDGITSSNPGVVHLNEGKLCPFETGDYVVFREVQGMTELNHLPHPVQIKKLGKYAISICDTTGFKPYEREGIVTRVNVPSQVHFRSLKHRLREPIPRDQPGFIEADMTKLGRSKLLHVGFLAISQYTAQQGELRIRDEECVAGVTQIAQQLHLQMLSEKTSDPDSDSRHIPEQLDLEILRLLVLYAPCCVAPICGFIGSIAAQEIVKFTGKFTPINQFFYFDAFETLLPPSIPIDPTPCQDRYDHQRAIWGREFQKQLGQLNLFIVGVGALGCELLKNCALLGCCLEKDGGTLTITDMDNIELSNLNRQFLFRREHVGKSKSGIAAKIIKTRMNPGIHIVAHEQRVGPETEAFFNESFYERQTLLLNALDNINSRLYIDSRCVLHKLPLLESGTLGTKANSQVILPHRTQCYGDSRDAPEEAIPLCTLKHFPNQIEHTIEWARDAFETLFCSDPLEASICLSDPDAYMERMRREVSASVRVEKLQRLIELLKGSETFQWSLRWAIKLFVKFFHDDIAQLLHTFPLDHTTSSGLPFWSGPKRAPDPIAFDYKDPLHMSFVFCAASLICQTLDIPISEDQQIIDNLLGTFETPQFKPKTLRYRVEEGDNITVESAENDEELAATTENQLKALALSQQARKINPAEFNKDDDTNYHVQFIHACANLRARNYRIKECSFTETKLIAGKIVPAVATTTTMITSLVALELIKTLHYKDRKLEDFKNGFVNLAINFYCLSEPCPPIVTKDKTYDPLVGGPLRAKPPNFTTWDILEFTLENATIRDIIRLIEESQNVEVSIVSADNICLYNSFLRSHQQRLDQPVNALMETLSKKPLLPGKKYFILEASCSDAADGVITL